MSESVVEDSVAAESSTEKIDDTGTDDREDVNEALIEDPDTIESSIDQADDTQIDGQAGEVIEAAAETERPYGRSRSLQTEDEQTCIVVDAEDTDSAESLSQETEDTQTGKLTDDVSESVVEDSVAAESSTEKIDDTGTDDRPEEVNEALIEDPDTIESRIEKADDTQTDSQPGEVIEVAAETERPAEEAESLQAEDEQAGIVVDAEDTDSAESLSQETEDTQTGKLTDDVSESVVEDSVAAESPTEKIDDTTRTDDQHEVTELEDISDTAAESQTVVDRIKKLFSGIFRIGSKADDSAEEGIESPETVANHTGKIDDTRTGQPGGFPNRSQC